MRTVYAILFFIYSTSAVGQQSDEQEALNEQQLEDLSESDDAESEK